MDPTAASTRTVSLLSQYLNRRFAGAEPDPAMDYLYQLVATRLGASQSGQQALQAFSAAHHDPGTQARFATAIAQEASRDWNFLSALTHAAGEQPGTGTVTPQAGQPGTGAASFPAGAPQPGAGTAAPPVAPLAGPAQQPPASPAAWPAAQPSTGGWPTAGTGAPPGQPAGWPPGQAAGQPYPGTSRRSKLTPGWIAAIVAGAAVVLIAIVSIVVVIATSSGPYGDIAGTWVPDPATEPEASGVLRITEDGEWTLEVVSLGGTISCTGEVERDQPPTYTLRAEQGVCTTLTARLEGDDVLVLSFPETPGDEERLVRR